MVALRAAGGFGDSTSGKKSEAAAKEAVEVKADDPKAALDADIEAMRSAMGASSKGSDTLQSFGESSMEPSVPEKQVSVSVSLCLCLCLSLSCLLYTSPSPRDVEESRMPSSA